MMDLRHRLADRIPTHGAVSMVWVIAAVSKAVTCGTCAVGPAPAIVSRNGRPAAPCS